MQIVKQKRTYWRIEPGNTDLPYATVERLAGYNIDGEWVRGWHVRLRAPNGLITSHGGVYPTRDTAATAAIALLKPTALNTALDAHFAR